MEVADREHGHDQVRLPPPDGSEEVGDEISTLTWTTTEETLQLAGVESLRVPLEHGVDVPRTSPTPMPLHGGDAGADSPDWRPHGLEQGQAQGRRNRLFAVARRPACHVRHEFARGVGCRRCREAAFEVSGSYPPVALAPGLLR